MFKSDRDFVVFCTAYLVFTYSSIILGVLLCQILY